MGCAYAFAVLALAALPQTLNDSFAAGFHPLPLVTWLSQTFIQLTMLSVIMVGQELQGRGHEERDNQMFDAVMEVLADMREEHAARHQEVMAR